MGDGKLIVLCFIDDDAPTDFGEFARRLRTVFRARDPVIAHAR
jgi:hypothetical protein